MNAFAALLLVVASQDIPAGYVAFFEKGVETKAGLVKSAEERIAAQEIEVAQAQQKHRVAPGKYSGKDVDSQRKTLLEMRKALKDLNEVKPFTFLGDAPAVGDVGMIKECVVRAVYDEKTMLVETRVVAHSKKDPTAGYAILIVPSTKKIPYASRASTPNHVFVVTESVSGDHSGSAISAPVLAAAMKDMDMRTKKYFVAEVVSPSLLNKYRAAHAETQKQEAK